MIYFAETDALSGLVKIGMSHDPACRLRSLRMTLGVELSLIGTVPGGTLRERDVHVKFSHIRVRFPKLSNGASAGTEWFLMDGDLRDFITTSVRDQKLALSDQECRYEFAFKRRVEGHSFADIGRELGVSRQAASYMVDRERSRLHFASRNPIEQDAAA